MSKTVVHDIAPTQVHGFESVSGDRPYTSELFTKLHNSMTLGGYASNEAGHLDVFATGSDKIVTVQKGTAFIAGHFLQLKNTHDVALNDAPAGQIRWDLIAIRIDRATAERKISIIKIEGNSTATDDTSSIPWDQLQTDDLLLGSGIFEFPIAAIKTSGTANITQDRITKTLSSVNALEPFPVILDDALGLSTQLGGRILIPNEPATNTPHEITIRVEIPKTTSTKELALVINDFLGADTMIPVVDQSDLSLQANTLSEQSIFITISADKTKAVTQTPLKVYNVQPLTTQITTQMVSEEIKSTELDKITKINSITIHNDKIYFTAYSIPSVSVNSTYVADINDDGTFSNYKIAFNSTFLRLEIMQITFLNNDEVLIMYEQSSTLIKSHNKFKLQPDGTLTYIGGFDWDPDSINSGGTQTWRGATMHNGKLYIINDDPFHSLRYDIDANNNLTNGVLIFQNAFGGVILPTKSGYRSIKFINERCYLMNNDPEKCLTTTETDLYHYDFNDVQINFLNITKYITDKSEFRAMEYYPKLNRIYYWNSVDKIMTYSKQIDIIADSPILTEAMSDAKYKPIGDNQ